MAKIKPTCSICRAGGAGPITPTLVGPKIFSFIVKALYFQSSGRIDDFRIEVLFKWSDQSHIPSAAPDLGFIKMAQTTDIDRTNLFYWFYQNGTDYFMNLTLHIDFVEFCMHYMYFILV